VHRETLPTYLKGRFMNEGRGAIREFDTWILNQTAEFEKEEKMEGGIVKRMGKQTDLSIEKKLAVPL